jgi:PhnB protein
MKKQEETPNGPPPGLTPILAVDNANAAVDFYKQAFEAIEIARIPAPDGKRLIHARMQIFGTIFVLMDEFPELSEKESMFRSPNSLGGSTVTLHLQVNDAFEVWKHAIDAGAIAIVPMEKQFWGEYYGRLKDPFGHEWTIAQMLQHLTNVEVENAANEIFKQNDIDKLKE